MKLPISWLKDYIDVALDSGVLAERLTMSGTAVEGIDKKQAGEVLHVEVTTNRPDCLSIVGLAREVSALTTKKVRFPLVKSTIKPKAVNKEDLIKITIEAKKVCALYSGRLIQNVSIKTSPTFAQSRLDLVGLRPVNNVVDVTNFVLFEMGQPLHAFDAEKIRGGRIIVRFSKKGEKFLGINGVEYVLDEKTLVIADVEGPVAIAGVIGGKLSEVGLSTKHIFLESAYFDPVAVRQAAKRYKVATDSSYRFERGVDIAGVPSASARAADLIREWAGGQEIGFWAEHGEKLKAATGKMVLTAEAFKNTIGYAVSGKRIQAILKNLGFAAKLSGKYKVVVSRSSRRRDIEMEADLVEEVLRIEGFEKVPTAIPVTRHTLSSVEDRKLTNSFELKRLLAGLGFREIITYSLLSGKALSDSGWHDLSKTQKIVNPLSVEQEFFRPSLLPGALQAVIFNVHRKAEALRFFEIGNCYVDGSEETRLGVALSGEFENHWKRKNTVSFWDLKGILENIFDFLDTEGLEWKDESNSNLSIENAASLNWRGKKIGDLGKVSASVQRKWDIPQDVFFAEIILDEVLRNALLSAPFKVKPVPKFPSVRRDIAFVLDEKITVRNLEDLMKKTGVPYLAESRLFDEFKGKNVASGKRSLAFSLSYQKPDGTFTDEEINTIQNRIGDALKKEYGVEFR